MTNLETIPQILPQPEVLSPQQTSREAWLRSILGTDYEYAQPLVEQFTYNPETEQDGLRHILSGNIADAGNGVKIASGFHHEPSGGVGAFVDRRHLQTANSRTRLEFIERPFEPYRAKTFVDGKQKVTTRIDDNGEIKIVPQESSMFPKEYDALAVMKTVINARDTRDRTKDKEVKGNKIETEGHWFMLDGESMMKIKLVVDKESEKIITASPVVKSYMKLSPDLIKTHLGL